MRRHGAGLLTLVAMLALWGLVEAGKPAPAEPAERFILEVDGRDVPVRIDVPFAVEIEGKQVPMKLRVLPYRELETAAFRFRYPRRFEFTYEDEDEVPTWTVEGPATFIQFTQHDGTDPATALEQFVEEIVAGGEVVRRAKAELRLGKLALVGVRIDQRSSGGVLTRSELYGLRVADKTFVLQLFDSLTYDDEPTKEMIEALELLRESFQPAR